MKNFVFALAAVAVLLGGCATTGSKFQLTGLEYSDALKDCEGEPVIINPNPTQKDVAVLVARLKHARKDCAGDLQALNEVIAKYNEQIDAFNKKQKAR